ncbi:MAG: PKD domain-containing protein, partial [Candidatus Cloacimonetes bacterium]|nr:PKD domain-containing protein [Candidatus Cloacimonadota bacterium]
AHWDIHSGRNEGEIFDSLVKHSINYGANFISHSMNGFFGSRITTEIDNQNELGYVLVNQYGIPDTLWLLITYDNFENLDIQNVYNIDDFPLADLSRGTEYGELYNFADTPKTINYSNDYGLTWEYINDFNYGLDYTDLVGGRQEGEVYVLVTYTAYMHTIDHIYIFHSTDYGRTFTVYHPFAKGEEPLVANFSSSLTEGEAPFTIQFSNYSVGDILSYEWDFDNDGTVDSYEIEPEYTYQDTGYYSVKLIIHDQDDTDEFLREDYIHVTDSSFSDDEQIENTDKIILNNSPNPFNPSTIINYVLPVNIDEANIEIYNVKGQKIKEFDVILSGDEGYIVWNGKDSYDKHVSSGIYLYKLNIKNSPIKKMILLK